MDTSRRAFLTGLGAAAFAAPAIVHASSLMHMGSMVRQRIWVPGPHQLWVDLVDTAGKEWRLQLRPTWTAAGRGSAIYRATSEPITGFHRIVKACVGRGLAPASWFQDCRELMLGPGDQCRMTLELSKGAVWASFGYGDPTFRGPGPRPFLNLDPPRWTPNPDDRLQPVFNQPESGRG